MLLGVWPVEWGLGIALGRHCRCCFVSILVEPDTRYQSDAGYCDAEKGSQHHASDTTCSSRMLLRTVAS